MERENVCNMPEVARIEIHKSAETGNYYATWIGENVSSWTDTKPLSKEKIDEFLNYLLIKEET